jgi:hypothetical protein
MMPSRRQHGADAKGPTASRVSIVVRAVLASALLVGITYLLLVGVALGPCDQPAEPGTAKNTFCDLVTGRSAWAVLVAPLAPIVVGSIIGARRATATPLVTGSGIALVAALIFFLVMATVVR